MQVYKSTADAASGISFFTKYSKVTSNEKLWVDTMRKNQSRRRTNVQADLEKVGEKIEYRAFAPSLEGLIESHRFHHTKDLETLDAMRCYWEEQKKIFGL